MGGFAQGFAQGFANTMAENITKKKDDAREYFNRQMELARTVGVENRRRAQQATQGYLGIAKQLEAAGVPKEIIMAQVSSNPEGLASFYEGAEKMRAAAAEAGKPLTPEIWKSIYTISGEYGDPNEDLATFIQRTYDPLSSAIQQEDFDIDPKGNFVSMMFGNGLREQADARLGQTEVYDGLTAEQLLQYGDGMATPQRGNAVVTTNYEAIPTRDKNNGVDDFTLSERKALSEEVDGLLGVAIDTLNADPKWAVDEGDNKTPEAAAKIVEQVVSDFRSGPYSEVVSDELLTTLIDKALASKGYPPLTELAGEAQNSPVEGGEDVPAPTPTPTPSEASVAPSSEPVAPTKGSPFFDPVEEPNMQAFTVKNAEGEGYTLLWQSNNDDGTVTYTTKDGEEITGTMDEFRALQKQFR